MRKYLTASDIANTARMVRTRHRGSILILEGDTDARVYKRLVDMNRCELIPANGKDNAIDALTILETSKFLGVLVIVDSDFFGLDSFKPKSSNLLLTDTHDLETMLISSPALDKLLSEFGSVSKIRNLGRSIRSILLDSCLPLGYFRWLSSPSKYSLSLRFKDLPFDRFVAKGTLIVNLDNLMKQVKAISMKTVFDEVAIKKEIQFLISKQNNDPWHVCCGHDLIQVLSMGLKTMFGNRKAKSISTQVVDAILRVAYEYSYFCSTQLYRRIRDWEKVHKSFGVLP